MAQIGGLSYNGAIPLGTQTQTGVLGGSSTSSGAINLGSAPSSSNPVAPKPVQQGSIQGMLNIPQTPAPSTAVKSTTVAHPSGATVTTNYHAPEPTPSYDAKTGFLTDYGKSIGAKAVQPGDPMYVQPNTSSNSSSNSSNSGTTSGVIPQTYNTSATTPTPAVPQSNIIGGLLNQANGTNPEADKYKQQIQDIANTQATANKNIDTSGIDQSLATGQENVLNRTYAAESQAAQTGLSNALQQTGQQIQAGTAAANANAPITGVPYGTQTINPATGQPYATSGATGGVSVDPNNPVASLPALATAVMNGQMTIDQANSALNNNVGMTTNLRNQILAKNPNFNFVQSSSSGTTQATGQQLKASVDTANKALDTLSTSFNSLPGAETGGIPLTNSIAQWIGTQLGSSALQQYKTNLADARAQLVGVLNTSGGTPTGNENTALQYLPDNMTLAQFNTNVGTQQNPGIVRQLMSQKLTSFSGSGSQNGTSGSTTGGTSTSGFGWNG